VAYPPKVLSEPTVEGYCNLFNISFAAGSDYIAHLPPPTGRCDLLARSRGMVIAGASKTPGRLVNSVVMGFGSTFLSVFLGTPRGLCVLALRVPGKDDLPVLILSTALHASDCRCDSIYLMYRQLGLLDTAVGMILLYTAVTCHWRSGS